MTGLNSVVPFAPSLSKDNPSLGVQDVREGLRQAQPERLGFERLASARLASERLGPERSGPERLGIVRGAAK